VLVRDQSARHFILLFANLGARRHERIEYRRPGFIIPAPDAPWLECFILDISDSRFGGNVAHDTLLGSFSAVIT
jgi:hypothetical protein